jgi:hypothetical protein
VGEDLTAFGHRTAVVEQEEVDVAKLDVSGSFLITGDAVHGIRPETWVVICVTKEDGRAKGLHFQDPISNRQPVEFHVALSGLDRNELVPLHIVELGQISPGTAVGFYWLRVETTDGSGIAVIRPSTLTVVVDDGTDHGQALICSCSVANVTQIVERG